MRHTLTARQAEIVALVAEGKSAKTIARELGISARTVDDHIRAAAARLPGAGKPRHRLTIYVRSRAADAEAS